MRVPFIAAGPGIKAGTYSAVPVVGYDFLATFADLAGSPEKLPEGIEGGTVTKDLAVAIHGTTNPPDGSYVFTDDFLDAIEAKQKELLG